jgi:hypothetical protein
MNPPKIETNPKNTNSTPAQPVQAPAPAAAVAAQAPNTKQKPVTIQLTDELHRKLKMVAFSKGSTTSGLCENYIEAAVKRDLVLVVAKLSE